MLSTIKLQSSNPFESFVIWLLSLISYSIDGQLFEPRRRVQKPPCHHMPRSQEKDALHC